MTLPAAHGNLPLPPDLDLAFSSDDDLPDDLLAAAGDLADPLAGADLWHGALSVWLAQLQGELPPELAASSYSLGLTLVNDAAMAELNADWRQKEGPTDVLAFAAQEEAPPLPTGGDDDEDSEPLELGDIVISVETAARQAEAAGQSLARELTWLASHGLLHLLGWDHPDDARLEAMLARQDQLLEGIAAAAPAGSGDAGPVCEP
ncbi:MAG: rRNA maturation RNase YbeY [Cyanobium sp.]|uniref:rRNA maturation RNase YbeY n=1 Tax=Synechococcus sp. CS-1333 TaxID=2848638 RepID=UPI000DBBF409|nr:rRNA maturation RNase YbeY [Synechococcus sp. CS-1333]MCT0209737.1 rRNA maturation RNase YbeY [Synechococcus sp. CS-1333]PZV23360.1 MAG: rRNA maturation RNase YbeY [Cyanobium sp.]